VLLDLIEKGWEPFYREIFGDSLVDAFDSAETGDTHHSDAVSWHWNARIALLNGKRPPDDYFVYFPTWSRGNMKTSIGRAMLITDAMLSYAYGQRGYALIPGGTKAKVKGNAVSVEAMLKMPTVQKYCPALSKVETNVYGRSRGWTADFISTQAGYVFHFIGLDEGVAGANVDNVRPTFLMPDDVDSRETSPVISESRLNILTSEIIPTRQANTLVYWAQNLISRYSVRYRIEQQQERVLVDRKFSDPVPAVRGLVTEQRTIGGIIKDIVVAGKPTWRGWDIQRVQDEINSYGLPAFLRECHPAGTRVRLGWNENVPIEQIRVGDRVLTHQNRLRPVSELIRREYSGDLYKFKLANASVPLQTTANHPLLAAVPPTNWRWQGKKRDPATLSVQWHKASELTKGAYLLEPVPTEPPITQDGLAVWTFTEASSGRPAKGTQVIRATPELMRLVGYYLAEGSIGTGSVSLTFHENEKEYIADVVRLFKQVFGLTAKKRPDNGRSVKIECHSAIAASFFKSVGVGSHFKSVPDWVFMSSNDLIKELIIGYWRGDGCKDPSGFAYNTVSEQLAEHIRLLLLRLGIVAGLYRLKERDVTLPQGTRYRRSQHWQGDINGHYATKMGELVGVEHKSTSTRSSCFIHAGYVWKPIRGVKTESVEDFPVFNFEVDEDESYVAENISSHNCQHEVEGDDEGKILYNYDDDVHVISESEFSAVYGSMDAWLPWRKKWANDWARTKTDKHANVAAWLTVSDQSTKLPNFTFLMHPTSFPANTAPEDVAESILSYLSPFAYKDVTWERLRKDVLKRTNADIHTRTIAERISYEHGELSRVIPLYSKPLLQRCNVQAGDMSHEQDTVRKIYTSVYGLGMKPVNPKKHGGVEAINREMMVDYTEPHPFRAGQNGYSQWFVVVPDDKTREYNKIDGKPVYMPKPYPLAMQTKDLWHDDLFRFQCSNFRYRDPVLTAIGEVVDDPLKLYDDFPQMLQMMAVGSPLRGTSLTTDQKLRLIMPQQVQKEMAEAKTGAERWISSMNYEFERSIAEAKLKPIDAEDFDYE